MNGVLSEFTSADHSAVNLRARDADVGQCTVVEKRQLMDAASSAPPTGD
jgi:hypothetical protein